ncbi:MAG: hypothetical protein CL910_08355 [Deltaproteobacteria bacterium]|jgi:hypothetical protein|nr:hypothetical protein [Deltaproteobacteria bacterium]
MGSRSSLTSRGTTSGPTCPTLPRPNEHADPGDTSLRLSTDEHRALFLNAQGLGRSRRRRPTRKALLAEIEALGFVQVDAIQVIERAHHLILGARFQGYRPRHLKQLLERDRSVFEHWTHDAAVIPASLLPWWTFHFGHWEKRLRARAGRRAGSPRQFAKLRRVVRQRILDEGPLLASDFETPSDHPKGSFWNWKPAKHALEYLWRTGELAIEGRDGFHKRYDLFERVHPECRDLPKVSRRAYLDWAMPAALERLCTATPRELAGFWGGIGAADASAWCRRALGDGRVIEVETERGGTRSSLALPDLQRRVARLRTPPDELRFLCPFDPLLRDRARTARLFGFDYRFEGFVPAEKRRDGYFVMAVLDGDELVARFDPRLDRPRRTLELRRLRWEERARTARRVEALEEALRGFALDLGAEHVVRRRS